MIKLTCGTLERIVRETAWGRQIAKAIIVQTPPQTKIL